MPAVLIGPKTLAAASATNIAAAQTLGGAGAFTLVSTPVTLDQARRVLFTSVGNDSAITFTVTGTDRYARTQSETLTGGNATTVYTTRDFASVTAVTASGATAANVSVGTNSIASSEPLILNQFVAPSQIGVTAQITAGAVTYSIELTAQDFSPNWDMTVETPYWYAAPGFSYLNQSVMDVIDQPASMLRLTILAGTGTIRASILQGQGYSQF